MIKCRFIVVLRVRFTMGWDIIETAGNRKEYKSIR
jgi:hypothetical protein